MTHNARGLTEWLKVGKNSVYLQCGRNQSSIRQRNEGTSEACFQYRKNGIFRPSFLYIYAGLPDTISKQTVNSGIDGMPETSDNGVVDKADNG